MPHVTAHGILGLGLLLRLALGGASAVGAQLYVYPNKGQSSEQQSRDRYGCHRAVQQSGHDPTRAQTAQSPSPPHPGYGENVGDGRRYSGRLRDLRRVHPVLNDSRRQLQRRIETGA
jgi:hypothetical protein